MTRANLPRPPGAKFDLKAEPMTPRERELLEAEKQKRLAEIEARKQQAMIQNQAAAQQKPGVKP